MKGDFAVELSMARKEEIKLLLKVLCLHCAMVHQGRGLLAPPVVRHCHTLNVFLSSFVLYPSKPSAHTLTLPHPNLLIVTLTWLQLEKSKGWAACTLGSRLILVSWLYLFSLLLPLYSLTKGTAWLVILNRTPDLSTKVSSFRTSHGKCWSVEGREGAEKEGALEGEESGGQDTAPGCAHSLASDQITLLQVTTGHTKVRADLQAAWHSFHPGTPSSDMKTCPGEEEKLSLSFTH